MHLNVSPEPTDLRALADHAAPTQTAVGPVWGQPAAPRGLRHHDGPLATSRTRPLCDLRPRRRRQGVDYHRAAHCNGAFHRGDATDPVLGGRGCARSPKPSTSRDQRAIQGIRRLRPSARTCWPPRRTPSRSSKRCRLCSARDGPKPLLRAGAVDISDVDARGATAPPADAKG